MSALKDPEVATDPVSSPAASLTDYPEEEELLWVQFVTKLGWYRADQPAAEKNLVLKLDLCILVFGSLSFFTKYLDQQSVTNAYVSGMKKDLDLKGNDINYITAVFWASYCSFMIPACYFMTRYPANIVLPSLEVGWGLATFGMAWAQNIQTIYAMRFFVGLFECCTFTGTIYVIGSWYKPQEIARRVSIFCIAAPAGTMFAGYLQAAVYKHMNGTAGLAGWRWQFIIDAAITFAISIIGFTVFPDIPSRGRPLMLSDRDLALSRQRIQGLSAPPQLKLSADIFRRVLGSWHFYVFVLAWTVFDLNIMADGTPFSLYLSAKSPELYSVVQVNTLPTIPRAINIVTALIIGACIDRWGNFCIPVLVITTVVVICDLMLVIWDIGESGRLASFFLLGIGGPMSPILMSWATLVMSSDAEERAIVTASMNGIGQGIVAGLQVVLFPAVQAPRWVKGFQTSLATGILQILVALLIFYLHRREKRYKEKQAMHSDYQQDLIE